MEVSTILVHLLEVPSTKESPRQTVSKEDMTLILEENRRKIVEDIAAIHMEACSAGWSLSKSWAAGARQTRVHTSRGPVVRLKPSTSLLVLPDEDAEKQYASSQATRDVLCKVLKPSDCALKINRISHARKNDIRIEAKDPDIERLRQHPGLASAGLKIMEDVKLNPRLIVRGVPVDMTASDIATELMAQRILMITRVMILKWYLYILLKIIIGPQDVIEVTLEMGTRLLKYNRKLLEVLLM